MAIKKRLLWVGAVVATWQFLGCSRISEQIEQTANAIGTVGYQTTHRKIYQHSVIPGGAYSGQELARARRTDPVVAAHYADFGSDAQVARLAQDEFVYVSYRKADKVYWTKKKHRVCQGEAVITDGKKNLARARCGNRLSKTPKLPNAKTEPSEAVLNTPEVAPMLPTADSGAGPFIADNLPVPGIDPSLAQQINPGIHVGTNPNAQTGATNGKESGTAPVATGAGAATTSQPDAGFYPSSPPYFGAGPVAAPAALINNAGGGTVAPTTGTGTTTTSGGTPTTPGSGATTTTVTPEPASLLLLLLGGTLLYQRRRLFSS